MREGEGEEERERDEEREREGERELPHCFKDTNSYQYLIGISSLLLVEATQ